MTRAPNSREGDIIAFLVNATPMVQYSYRLGVPKPGFYRELINTGAETEGGSNIGNLGGVQAVSPEWVANIQSSFTCRP